MNDYDPKKIAPESAFLIKLFQLVEKENISCCVLRDYVNLPFTTNGSDIDFLVIPEQINKLVDLIDKAASNTKGLSIIRYKTGESYGLGYLGTYEGRHWGVKFDVMPDLLYRSLSFCDKEILMNRIENHDGVAVLNNNDAVFIGLMKECLNNGESRKGYEEKARLAYREEKSHIQEILKGRLGEKAVFLWESYLSCAYSISLIKVAKVSRKSLFINSILQHPLKTLKNKANFHIDRLRRIPNKIGFSVAFLGSDGSGKSTIIKEIQNPLESALHTKINYEHMRPNILPSIASLFGRGTNKGPVTNPHASKPSGVIGSIVRLCYYSVDYIVGYWVKIYPQMVRRASLFVFDRYFFDYLIDPVRSRIRLPNRVIETIGLLIPEPDLILCLGTDPKTIHSRKPELSVSEIEQQIKKLKKFCADKNSAVWIDTGQDIQSSVSQAIDAITNKMASRYE